MPRRPPARAGAAARPGVSASSVRLGRLELFLLSDGTYHADGGGPFGLVPRALWSPLYPPDEDNRIPMALNCLLVRGPGYTLLVDTGLGDKLGERQRQNFGLERQRGLLQELADLGLAPEEVDVVINTHLHADHCGGNTRLQGGKPVPAFPRARYLLQRRELADASFPDERTRATYFAENFEPLAEAGQVELLSGDTQVTAEVRTLLTRGHTRAHQSVVLQSEGHTAVFLADVAFLTVHLERLAWVSAYDLEPQETMETKRSLRERLLEWEALLFFEHEVRTPAGRLRRAGERWQVEPVPLGDLSPPGRG